MIHRIRRGEVPPKPHIAFRPNGEDLAYEHCFTRQGFDGLYTIMYHRAPPHWVLREEAMGRHPGWAEPVHGDRLRRAHFDTTLLAEGGSPSLGRKLYLTNPDIGVWISRPTESDSSLFANADSDEMTFVHEGSGRVESPLGLLPFGPGDYVYMPRGLPHRWILDDGPGYLMVMEGRTFIDLPKQFRHQGGQITMDAPYSHRDFGEPEWPEGGMEAVDAPRELISMSEGCLTRFEQHHNPFDVIGWDGQMWPFTFPIRAYQPKTGLVHLPPTIHITFAGGGFVICSFVPRLVDFHEQAIPCPYPHSSPDCDEIIFYVDGNFTSRKGIHPGSISYHPRGIPHGPHPGRYEASIGENRTSELAVMVDTFKNLLPTKHALGHEDAPYNTSFVDEEELARVLE